MRDSLLPAPFTRLSGIFWLILLTISAVQLAAIYSFFEDYWGWPMLLAAPAATIITGIPLISSLMAIVAAYSVWHWALWQAIALLGAPAILWLSLELLAWLYRRLTSHA